MALPGSLRAGVIGVGKLGREHARIYSSNPMIVSLALYDRDIDRASSIAVELGAVACRTIDELLSRCDVASICTPATHHCDAALAAFERGVHVLVEKPIASSSSEAARMIEKARARGLVLQVGHIERFNGAFRAARSLLRKPMFIEAHRLTGFTGRGLDVSVVQDLMIHDIDLILAVIGKDELSDLHACGTNVMSPSADIVNARLEFEGGCTANVTASRISMEPMRKIRFFEENRYVSVDLRAKSVEAYERILSPPALAEIADPASLVRKIEVEVDDSEPLRKEIDAFLEAACGLCEPAVSGEQALSALEIAEKILEIIEQNGKTR